MDFSTTLAIIRCGGMGSRVVQDLGFNDRHELLGDAYFLTKDSEYCCKTLLSVNGKSVLHRQIEGLTALGVKNISIYTSEVFQGRISNQLGTYLDNDELTISLIYDDNSPGRSEFIPNFYESQNVQILGKLPDQRSIDSVILFQGDTFFSSNPNVDSNTHFTHWVEKAMQYHQRHIASIYGDTPITCTLPACDAFNRAVYPSYFEFLPVNDLQSWDQLNYRNLCQVVFEEYGYETLISGAHSNIPHIYNINNYIYWLGVIKLEKEFSEGEIRVR